MSTVDIFVTYELYKGARLLAYQTYIQKADVGENGEVDILLPGVGARINFNGDEGLVTEQSGANTGWLVKCEYDDPCPYTFAHTRHWCGYPNCRDS